MSDLHHFVWCCQSCANPSLSDAARALRATLSGRAAATQQVRLASYFEGLAIDHVAFKIEVIVDVGVDRGEFSQRLHSPEPEHCPLLSSAGKVTVFGPVVVPSTDFAKIEISQFAHGCGVGFEPGSDDGCNRATALPGLPQKERSD